MEKREPPEAADNTRRKFLNIALSTMLVDMGFDSAEKQCLETLCEMYQSLLFEIGNSSRSYCELAGRTTPVVGDVVLALINMGVNVKGLDAFAKKMSSLPTIPVPVTVSAQKSLSLLQAGTKQPHPPYIPSHLPVLPDPHAYIRTPTHKQPVTEYEAIREKAATQKRDIEKALTKFLAKTSDTHSLFLDADDANQMFPLIACKPAYPAYMAALNPTDQVFDFEELEYHYQVANRTEDADPSKDDEDDEDDDDHDESKEMDGKNDKNDDDCLSQPLNDANNSANIDNPFLRAATNFKTES